MRYYRTAPPAVTPQLLNCMAGGSYYQFELLHSSVESHPRGVNVSPKAHCEDHYHLLLYTAGEGAFLLDGERVDFERGTLVLSSPRQSHHFYPRQPNIPFEYCELTFAYRAGESYLRAGWQELLELLSGAACAQLDGVALLSEGKTVQLERLLRGLIAGLQQQTPQIWYRAWRAVGDLFEWVINSVAVGGAIDGAATGDPLCIVKQEIELRFDEKLSVADLAAQVQLSTGYLQRCFKRRYGFSPLSYQKQLRLEAAKEQLRHSNMPVGDIALSLGFGDIYHFSKSFSRAVGMSPLAFKKGLAREQNINHRKKPS